MLQSPKFNIDYFLKCVRFGITGAFASLVYVANSLLLKAFTGLELEIIHIISYIICVPISYIMQKQFTFKHDGEYKKTVWKFAVVTLLGFLLGFGIINVVEMMDYPFYIATVSIVLAIPITNFLLFDFWTFKKD